jgi:hypothetical protein
MSNWPKIDPKFAKKGLDQNQLKKPKKDMKESQG